MMTNIEKLEQFEKEANNVVSFDASVINIKNEGNKTSRAPISVECKLEKTGELFSFVTWNFDLLDQLKKFVTTLEVIKFEGVPTIYKENLQVKVGKILQVYLYPSTQKILRKNVDSDITGSVRTFINENITKNQTCKKLLELLVLENKKFFIWPAAKTIHHNYKGGLAKHSLNVAKQVLNNSKIYGDESFDLEIALTGALLHDIGKINEYQENGNISFDGMFTTHLVSGVVAVDRVSQNMIDPDKKVIQIVKHIIQSHHEKLEYGSPVTPRCIEAVLVSMADLCDSKIEALTATYENLSENSFSEFQKVIGGPIYRWGEINE